MLRKLKKLLGIELNKKEKILDKIDDLVKEGEKVRKVLNSEGCKFYLIGVGNSVAASYIDFGFYVGESVIIDGVKISLDYGETEHIFKYLKRIYKKQ